jgi:hypothetical protein
MRKWRYGSNEKNGHCNRFRSFNRSARRVRRQRDDSIGKPERQTVRIPIPVGGSDRFERISGLRQPSSDRFAGSRFGVSVG